MARLVVLYNPLDASRRRLVDLPDETPLLSWLDDHEPAPRQCTRDVFVNGRSFADHADDAAYRTMPGDEILVAFRPGTGIEIGAIILQALIGAAIGFVLGRIFQPSRPKAGNTPSPSQVYGIGTPRNAARLGEPIPVVYGSVIALPDYAAQPYVEYAGNEQFLRAILCIGQGQHVVHEMLLGDSSASLLPADVASYQVFGPADHGSAFGVIQAATGIRENVVTSADVSDQELLAPNAASSTTPSTWFWLLTAQDFLTTAPAMPPVINMVPYWTDEERLALLPPNPPIGTVAQGYLGNWGSEEAPSHIVNTWRAEAYNPAASIPDGSIVPPPNAGVGVTKWIGPFETCKAGQYGNSLELDFVFAGGLYSMDNGGNLHERSVTILVERTQIDDNGAPVAAPIQTTTTYTASSNTPQRYTYKLPVPAGRYIVRCARQTNGDGKASTSDRSNWTGLKFALTHVAAGAPAYGDVTLVAVKLRASNGIAGDAASSIRFRVTRKLPPPAGGALAATVNPADAFADILCAPYGGNRPRNGDELDFAALDAARARWAGHNGFNAVFDQPSTVWEALSLSVQTVTAAPLPIGSRMSLMQDGVQPVRAQMFTDANIAVGSLQITHAFDRDGTPEGVRVEFRDPRSFSPAAYLLPAGAPDYETVSLFGCTDQAVAAEHARLIKNRRRLQRTNLVFITELEGLNCLPGDRIGVQALMPRWAQGARVVEVVGLVLRLDVELVWTPGEVHAIQLRDPEGHPHAITGVTQGITPYQVVLPAPPPFELVGYGDDLEPTLVAFGIDTQEITDWTVTTMQPQGERVTIQAVNYEPAVWTDTAAHLLLPLPFDEATR